ncbi:MAG: MFS transporter [Bacillota bacterium]
MKIEQVLKEHVENHRPQKGKELGLDAQGIQKTMKMRHYLGDGAGQVPLNAITGLVGMLTYFYTDKVGIAAGAVGTILLLSRVLDAFTDIAMGRIVERTKSKYGKARPWLLWMVIPTLLSILLLFTVPVGASSTIKNIYVFITLTLATAIVYTAISIPYNSIMALRTRSSEERGKMGITRAIFGYSIGMIVAIALIPFTNLLGGDQKAWIIVSVVIAMISSICLYITFLASKEEAVEAQVQDIDEEITIKESLKLLIKNKYWVIMVFVMFLMNMMSVLTASTGIYYTKYILGNENLISIMGVAGLIPVLLGFIAVGPMAKKFGPAKAVRIALIMGGVASLIRCFMPYSFTGALVLGGVTSFATIPLMALSLVLINNTVEYGEWKFGKRTVGMINSANSFGGKLGSGLGAALIGWILALGQYDATLAVQPSSSIFSILALTVYLPFIFFVVIYVLLRKYDLDLKYSQIVKELEERKANK